MTKLRIGQKVAKTGQLLIALRNAKIAKSLEPYGFSEEVVEEGWRLFMRATKTRLNKADPSARDPEEVKQLDEFEDHWFPVCQLVLARHYPEVADQLFLNLARADGKTAVYTVAVFLSRLEAMGSGAEPFEQNGPEVREYLRSRGLTDDIVATAKGQLERLQNVQETDSDDLELSSAEERQAAEEAMWAWYLEWSGLARRAVDDGNLLRLMGFKKRGAARTADDEVLIVEAQATEEEPTALPEAVERLALPAE